MNLSMNSAPAGAMNNTAPGAGAGAAADIGAVAPAAAGTVALDAALPAGAVGAQAAQPFPFQQWIALDGAPADASLDASADAAIAPAAGDGAPAEADLESAAAADMLLTAMALPMTPAAMPAMMMAMPGAPAPTPKTATGAAAAAAAGDAPAVGLDAVELLPVTPSAARGAADAALSPQLPAAPANPAATQVAAPAPAQAVAARADTALPAADTVAADAPDAASGVTASWGVQSATQPAAARGADSIALAGPPAAWRQTLHEALGERLQLQLGRGSEQATIRLEPPMLGRIDISVRHSGGNLEVHIAASNVEVLRQLNTVSDSLRNDLAGRQYANVSVNVGETPRTQASAQTGAQAGGQPGADAHGRGRQQDGQDGQPRRGPGLALNDAGDAGSLFTLNRA